MSAAYAVNHELFARYTQLTRQAFARGIGCEASAFDGERLTIVDRPADASWYTAAMVTFGTGTVLSIDPAYRDFAEGHRPKRHFDAMRPAFLQSLVAEGGRRGAAMTHGGTNLCFALRGEPRDIDIPSEWEMRSMDATWMNEEQVNRRFEHAVGEPGREGRDFRNRFALALFDRANEPVAVAGAFDSFGMLEIGVDTARVHRGRGLGRVVVSAMAREIVRRGDVPLYACASTNIRSHRTAESCGFALVAADTFLSTAQ